MKTDEKIAALLATDLSASDRRAVEKADQADKIYRSYWGAGNCNMVTESLILDNAYATLIKHDCVVINDMPADVWLLRLLRSLEQAKQEP